MVGGIRAEHVGMSCTTYENVLYNVYIPAWSKNSNTPVRMGKKTLVSAS